MQPRSSSEKQELEEFERVMPKIVHPYAEKRPVAKREARLRLRVLRPFNALEHWLVVFLRYGSLDNFERPIRSLAEVSRQLKRDKGTVRAILIRFHQRGNRVEDYRRRKNMQFIVKIITPELGEFLGSQATLSRWAGLSLNQRTRKLFSEKGVRLSKEGLWSFYKRKKITYRYANFAYKRGIMVQ
jgi:hypothetical protein